MREITLISHLHFQFHAAAAQSIFLPIYVVVLGLYLTGFNVNMALQAHCLHTAFFFFFLALLSVSLHKMIWNNLGVTGILVTNLQANSFESWLRLDVCIHDIWPYFQE